MRILKKYESFIGINSVKIEEGITDTPEISDDVDAIVDDTIKMQKDPNFMENERLENMIEKLKDVNLDNEAEVSSFCQEQGIDSEVYKQVLSKLKVTESFVFEELAIAGGGNVILAAIAALIMLK